MRKAALIALAMSLAALRVFASPICNYYLFEVPDTDSALVQLWYVVDGDTVRLSNGTYVRLVGYDAYELSEPMGPEAKQALENLCKLALQGSKAAFDMDDLEPRDKYGRLLGYLWCPYMGVRFEDGSEMVDWVNVNKWFLTQGSQYVKRALYIPPDEHPYWVWLTNHNIALPYFVNITSYSQPVLNVTPIGASRAYVTILSGRYEIKTACKLCEAKLYREMVINLISEKAKRVYPRISLHLAVVRGLDNRIYYALCNASACSAWVQLPGLTLDAPSAAANAEGSRVYVAVRGMDNGIYFGYFDIASQKFVGWVQLPGATPSRPVLVSDLSGSFSGKLVLVVRGMDNGIYYNVFDETTSKWSSWRRLPTGSTVDAPAAAVANGKLHIVVRGSDGRSIWYAYLDLQNWQFSGWRQLPGLTPSAPSMTSDGSTVWLAVRGMDNGIYLTVLSDEWNGWNRVEGSTVAAPEIKCSEIVTPDVVEEGGPILAVPMPVLHLAVIGSDGKSIWFTWVSGWYLNQLMSWSSLPGLSPSQVALAQIPP
jgi:endonuclease YncB( thermonuclease family)